METLLDVTPLVAQRDALRSENERFRVLLRACRAAMKATHMSPLQTDWMSMIGSIDAALGETAP